MEIDPYDYADKHNAWAHNNQGDSRAPERRLSGARPSSGGDARLLGVLRRKTSNLLDVREDEARLHYAEAKRALVALVAMERQDRLAFELRLDDFALGLLVLLHDLLLGPRWAHVARPYHERAPWLASTCVPLTLCRGLGPRPSVGLRGPRLRLSAKSPCLPEGVVALPTDDHVVEDRYAEDSTSLLEPPSCRAVFRRRVWIA